MNTEPSSSSSSSSANGLHVNGTSSHDDRVSTPAGAYPIDDDETSYVHALLDAHNADVVKHLYQSGFQTGNYADTVLHVHQGGHGVTFRLHAIILSRSPFLAHLMSTSQQVNAQRVLYVHLEPEATHEAFTIALGYLYSSASVGLIHEKNCRAVLASAHLLGGMDELCAYAYEACRRSISVDTIDDWLQFVDTFPPPSDGTATPSLPPPSMFGKYGERLRDDFFSFLVITLPQSLDIHADAAAASKPGRDILLQIFSRVPFDLFKTAMESPAFEIGPPQTRFKFAKDAVELRKRGIARGAEETVVLSNFGGSAIHITRKMRKRPLWKVSNS